MIYVKHRAGNVSFHSDRATALDYIEQYGGTIIQPTAKMARDAALAMRRRPMALDDMGESANRLFNRSRSETNSQTKQRRPGFATTEYNNQANDDEPESEKHLRSCLTDDQFEQYQRLKEQEEGEGGEDELATEEILANAGSDPDTPSQSTRGPVNYPARDEPPPFKGRPKPGGTMDRFTRRANAMDRMPRDLYTGPATPGDIQQRLQQRANYRRLRGIQSAMLAGPAKPKKRIAADTGRNHPSFDTEFPGATRIGLLGR